MTNASGTIVYVDADACPVKDEVTTIAIRHGCRAVMVCNGGIRPHPHPLIDLAIVNDGPDAAERGKDYAWLLLDQARIIEGEPLPDPVAFAQRMASVMEGSVS